MRQSLERFNARQSELSHLLNYRDIDEMDRCINVEQVEHSRFNYNCGSILYVDNSPLCRVAPIALFFYAQNESPSVAISYAALSTQQTHSDSRCVDACRYLCAIFTSILSDPKKNSILHQDFAKRCYKQGWFGSNRLHYLVERIAQGSFKKYDGYYEGIRSTHADILASLEAILWTLWKDNEDYEQGVIKLVQLGDDAPRVATVYGQLAGCLYGGESLPHRWIGKVYAQKFIETVARQLVQNSHPNRKTPQLNHQQNSDPEQQTENRSLWTKLFGKIISNKTHRDERPLNFGQDEQ